MYDVDFATATPIDIIKRSLVCHPSLFRDSLLEQAKMHADYLSHCSNALAERGARNLHKACVKAAAIEDAEEIAEDDMPVIIVALNTACRLQAIPFPTRTAIIVRHSEKLEQSK